MGIAIYTVPNGKTYAKSYPNEVVACLDIMINWNTESHELRWVEKGRHESDDAHTK